MPLILRAHQQKIVDLNPEKFGLWHGCGSGKTITAIALANKNAKSVLCVVPNLGGMLMVKWKKAVADYSDPEIQWTFVTKEYFRTHAKDIPYHDAFIWDEAHALGNSTSKMFKQARAWIKFYKPKYIWLLTATPYLSEASTSVYCYGNLLGKDWKWIDFRNRYFVPRHFGPRVIFVERDGIEHELAERMSEIGSTVQLKDCIDLPEHIIEEEVFEMTPEQKSLRKEVALTESNPLTRFGKDHQIASGVLLGNEYVENKIVKAHKNDRIMELVEKHPKIAIFSRYNAHLDYLAGLMAEHDIPYGVINGAAKDRPEVLRLLETSPRAVALINTSCSVGYELPSFTAIVFASCSWSFVEGEQSLGRFERVNNDPLPRIVYYLITKGTIDEDVLDSLKNKRSFSVALYSKGMVDSNNGKNEK